MSENPPSPERVLAGRYCLIERIGSGAFATTWKASDSRLLRTVAVKILRSDLAQDPQFSDRFAREAQAAAAVSSEFTVQIFDFGQTDDETFIAMEFIDGRSLRALLNASGGRLPVSRAV